MILNTLFDFLPKSSRPASYGKNEGKYPFFNSSNTIDKFVDEPDYDGEFLIIGDGGTGNCKYYKGKFSATDHTYLLKPKKNVNCKLVKYFLEKDNYKVLNDGFKGVGIKNVSKTYIQNIDFRKNEGYTDQEILKSLDSLNTIIALEEKQLKLYDELIKSRFVEMFGDVEKEPIFNTVKMGSVCNIGSSHRVFTSEFVNKGIPFYRGTEIGELANGKIPSDPYFISIEHYNRIACDDTKPQIGDILIPSICNKGQVWMVNTNDPFYYKDGRVLSISPNRKLINSKYFETYFKYKSLYEYPRLGDGATFAEFKIFILKEIDIILPPIELQNEFAAFVEQIDKSKFINYSRYFLWEFLTLFSSTIAYSSVVSILA